jgi:hypothetical protein
MSNPEIENIESSSSTNAQAKKTVFKRKGLDSLSSSRNDYPFSVNSGSADIETKISAISSPRSPESENNHNSSIGSVRPLKRLKKMEDSFYETESVGMTAKSAIFSCSKRKNGALETPVERLKENDNGGPDQDENGE